MKKLRSIFNESNLYIQKHEKNDPEDSEEIEEKGNKWVEIEQAHP